MAREPITCSVCELHAEAVFRVEGMDCNEEVVIRRSRERDTTVRRLGSLLRLATALAGHGFRRLWERRGTP